MSGDLVLSEVLRSIAAPIFAARRTGDRVVIHLAEVARQRRVQQEIVSKLAENGLHKVSVRFHSARSLLKPRSLEAFVVPFVADEIIYDPTQSLGRSQALVTAARRVRESLGRRVSGLFYAPRLRTLFVALNAAAVASLDKVKVSTLAEIEEQIASALRSSFDRLQSDCPAVRIGFGAPAAHLVPVDRASVMPWHSQVRVAVRRYWKPVAIAALFGFGANTAAAKGPAVAQNNLKVIGTGGTSNDEAAWFAGGIFTAPVGQSWGVQFEAAAGGVDDDTTVGLAGHVFTRDPDSYLLGLFASYAAEDKLDLDAGRLGAEAEIYLGQLSLLARAGYQFSSDINEGAFGDVEVRWYIGDNFVVSGGGSFDEENSFGRAGAEWQPGFSALPGLAFRVDGVVGDNDFDSLQGGITYYFGAPASLKDRHRKYDPDSALLSLFQTVQQEQQRLCTQYGSPFC